MKFLFRAFRLFPGRSLCTGCLKYDDQEGLSTERPFDDVFYDNRIINIDAAWRMSWNVVYMKVEVLREKTTGVLMVQAAPRA
jgi:hypothetical protein